MRGWPFLCLCSSFWASIAIRRLSWEKSRVSLYFVYSFSISSGIGMLLYCRGVWKYLISFSGNLERGISIGKTGAEVSFMFAMLEKLHLCLLYLFGLFVLVFGYGRRALRCLKPVRVGASLTWAHWSFLTGNFPLSPPHILSHFKICIFFW